MNKSLLDILACPMDKHYPLEMYGDGGRAQIEEAALYCSQCGRFYVVSDGIPIMLPDGLRDEASEKAALKKMADLPDKITKNGRPWNLA